MISHGRGGAARRPGTAQGTRLMMLLLHGLGGSDVTWDRMAGLAETNWELWDARLPWSASSDSAWSHLPAPSSWVADAMHAVPDGPDVVLAHSFSANLVLELLSDADIPSPSAVVLVSPFYRSTAEEFDWTSIARSVAHVDSVLQEGMRAHLPDGLAADLVDRMVLWARDKIGPYGWTSFFQTYLRTPFLRIENVRVPVLVISGDQDVAAGPEQARALADALPDGRLAALSGVGHFAMAQDPARFTELVKAFIESVVGATPTASI